MTTSPATLTLSPLGGLANRMRAMLAADALCRHIGSELRIVWQKEHGLNARFCDLFQPLHLCDVKELSAWEAFLYTPPMRRNLFLPHLYQSGHFDLCLFDWQLASLQHTPEVLAEMLRGKKVFIASGLCFFPTDDSLFGQYFHPVPSIQEEVERRVKALPRNTIGVHIRRTDNVVAIRKSPVELFVQRMEAFPDASFYLATDNEDIKTLLQQRFPGSVQFSPSKADRTSLAGMQEAVAELFTLARTHYFLGSYYSSFSDVVIALSGKGEIVLANSQSHKDEVAC